MATFSVTGERRGQRVTVTWTDGMLSGDAAAVERVKDLAHRYEGHLVQMSPMLPTYHDHLRSPYSASVLMGWAFPGKVETTELPIIPIPEGDIL